LAFEFEFAFPLPLGLHARPAGVIQEKTESFAGDVVWENLRTGSAADAKSVLSLVASDTRFRDLCRVRLAGPAAEEAGRELRSLILETLPRVESAAAEAAPAAPADVPRILIAEQALFFQGTSAGPGIARAPVFVHDPGPGDAEDRSGPVRPPQEETAAFLSAADDLAAALVRRRGESGDRTERAVLAAHLAILRDRAFTAKVEEIIASGTRGAAAAVILAGRHFSEMLSASSSLYLRERMADIRDISLRLAARIAGPAAVFDSEIVLSGPCILAAEDLSPSRFILMDKSLLRGLILEKAGVTSHTLILCRARGIPAMAGCPGILTQLRTGEDILLDGGRGLAVPAPSAAVARYYEREAAAEARRTGLRRAKNLLPGRTADGRRVEIAANIGDPQELAGALADGAEGVGLFRTELLLLGRPSAPDEEEQTALYARLAAESGGKPVIVRTFDIGGDKPLPFLPLPAESNPFLGFRGIRLYERFADLILAQLRALLRAAASGPLKIMVPMASTVEEIVQARALLDRARAELAAAGVPHRPDVEFGMMVEVPSAALLIDRFSDHADFFSVGSNDLLQYTFAADRGNPAVRGLNRPLHPAFLRLLRSVVAEAHARGKWVGLCGEIAADPRLLPVLVGLEFDELSMNPSAIPEIKARLRALDAGACRELVRAALASALSREVEEALDAFAAAGPSEEELIVPALVNLRSTSRTKFEVLQELAALLEGAERAASRTEVEAALWRREETFSTGIGFGVAIPHCQASAVRTASVGLLRFDTPVAWDAADGRPVDMALMLAIPAGGPAQGSLKYLARLSRRLVHDEFRDSLKTAADAAAVVRLISAALAD
jgi:phosphoenolpyruvate-protein phosphotransferase